MPYANISEVTACLDDCIAYADDHRQADYCQRYYPQLKRAKAELAQTWQVTDEHFAAWRREAGEDKVSWKNLAKLLRDVQDKLDRIDAIGYPDQRVMYWDEELLEAAVQNMSNYLASRVDQIEFAEDYLTRIGQLLDTAHSEHDESADALRSYRRFFRGRRDALSDAYHAIGEFRDSMRRDLGEQHPDYEAIRWAWSVSPDQSVL